MSPFFSILVPTYNQAQYLGEALDSLIAQTDPDWEAIIVNDGSTDNTADIIEAYCQKDSRFHAIHKPNGGTGSALNVGLDNVKGEWICWLSSDDLFEVNKLEIHRQWIADYPNHRFFFSDHRQLVGNTGQITNFYPNHKQTMPPIELLLIQSLRGIHIAGNSICVSRESWLHTGCFNEELRYAQDYDMWLRLMVKFPALFIPEYTYLQRVYPEQESYKFSDFCLYDAAKSSIQFLNQHSIEELCGLVDFKDSEQLKNLINIIIDIAFDRRAYIYQLGFHPLLLIKIKKFIDQFASNDKNIDFTYLKKIEMSSVFFKGTPMGIWCDFSKHLISNHQTMLEDSISVSYKKLAESYYWWLSYIEFDSHTLDGQNSLLSYLQRFCNSDISIESQKRNVNKSMFYELINFELIENQAKYIELINLIQANFSTNSSINKLILLEKSDEPLKYISKKVLNKYNYVIGSLIILLIYLLRSLRLFRQGILLNRFKEYIKYINRVLSLNHLKLR